MALGDEKGQAPLALTLLAGKDDQVDQIRQDHDDVTSSRHRAFAESDQSCCRSERSRRWL